MYTDHAPLQWLSKQKNGRNAFCRWALALQEYKFEIEYKPGLQNANADALSCLCSCIFKDESCLLTRPSHCLSRASLYQAQRNDPHIFQLCKCMSHSEPPPNAASSVVQRCVQLWLQVTVVDGVFCRCYKPKSMSDAITVPILPDSLHQQALRQAHDAPSAAHQGRLNKLDKLQQLAYWVGMNKDVEVYCREYYRCQETKPPAPK